MIIYEITVLFYLMLEGKTSKSLILHSLII